MTYVSPRRLARFWTDAQNWIASAASNLVHRTGNENIAGIKTFDNGNLLFAYTTTLPGEEEPTSRSCMVGMNRGSLNFGLHDNTREEWILYSTPYGNKRLFGPLTYAGTIITYENGGYEKGTAPSATIMSGLAFSDKNATVIGELYLSQNTSGGNYFRLQANNVVSSSASGQARLYLSYEDNGTTWCGPGTNGQMSCGRTNNKWSEIWASNGTIQTSDERMKRNIAGIPDEVLDAWGEVGWQQFQMSEAVETKGANARLHTGLIAQRIDEVFTAHKLDAARYGLFCYDEWPAKPAEYDADGNEVMPAQEAGSQYAVRYGEVLAMEAAYQRRRADQLEARIAALEKMAGNNGEKK